MAVAVALVGPGLVGREVLKQIATYQQRANPYPVLNVVGICTSTRYLVSEGGLELSVLDTHLATLKSSETCENAIVEFVRKLSGVVVPIGKLVLIDCTSSSDVAALYPIWLERGIHICTPNKKAFSSDLALWHAIEKCTLPVTAPMGYPLCYHESSVGAGLPVISTLKDLIATGDKFVKIEGILSGTLSYLFNSFSSPKAGESPLFSSVVMEAKHLGYTEPDPRDDLNGIDMARKIIILARLIGLDYSLETISVENIVPVTLRTVSTAEEFLAKLPDYDSEFAAMHQEALAEKQVLRYVGSIEKGADGSFICQVKLKRYAYSHPFAALQGSDNIIAFTTERFKNPLVIQGAGAGAAVTAHGVLSDLLKIATIIEYRS